MRDDLDAIGDDLIDLEGSVGATGEDFFGTLAHGGARAVTNKVTHDRLGWDFHLQLPRARHSHVSPSLDVRPPELSCFVQVKTTTRRRRSWRLALSTWERLAKERRPVFFFVAMLDATTLLPTKAYLVHLGETLLGEILRELRSIPPEDPDSIRDRTLAFKWSEADALLPLSGATLREAIERHVGPNLLAYEGNKESLLRTLGYPELPCRFSFSITDASAGTVGNTIAEFATGLRKQLRVELTKLADERFGIERPLSIDLELGETNIELADLKPDARGDLLIVPHSRNEPLRLPCELYVGGGFVKSLQPAPGVMRVTVDGCEFVWRNEGENRVLHTRLSLPDLGEQMPLSRAARIAAMALALTDPDGCDLVLKIAGKTASWKYQVPHAERACVAVYADPISRAAQLAARVGVDPNMNVEPAIFTNHYETLTVATMHSSMTAEIPMDDAHLARHENRRCGVLLPRELRIGASQVLLLIGLIGRGEIATGGSALRVEGTPELLSFRSYDPEWQCCRSR